MWTWALVLWSGFAKAYEVTRRALIYLICLGETAELDFRGSDFASNFMVFHCSGGNMGDANERVDKQLQEIQSLHLIGAHLGPAGAKMMRNVLAQNRSLIDIRLAPCHSLP